MIHKKLNILILWLITAVFSCAAVQAADSKPLPKEAVFLQDMGILNAYSPEAVVTKQMIVNSLEILGAVSAEKYFKSKDYTEPATVIETAAVLADMTGRGELLTKDNVLSVAAAAGITIMSGSRADDCMTMECYSKMLYDALNAELMRYTSSGGGKLTYAAGEETYLSSYMKMYEVSGVVSATNKTGLYGALQNTGAKYIKVGDRELHFDAEEGSYDEYLGMNVTALCKEDNGEYELVSIYAPESKNKIVTLYANDIIPEKTTAKSVWAYTNKENEYRIAQNAAYIYNGIAAEYVNDEDMRIGEGYVTLINSDNDNEYDTVKIISVESTVISQISEENARITGKNKTVYDVKAIVKQNEGDIYDENGGKTSISALKKNDVISVGYEKGTQKAVIVRRGRQISGTVNTCTDEEITLDGEKYGISVSLKNKKGGYSLDAIKPGTKLTAYINAFGELVGTEITGDIDLYGYMTMLYKEDGSESVKIKLFGADGIFHEYELNDKITFNSSRIAKEKLIDKSLSVLWSKGKINHQPIQYRVSSSGKLTKLTTAAENNRYASFDKDNFSFDYSGELRYLTGDWQSLGGLYKLKNDTVVINVPYDIQNEDLFYIVKPTGWGNWTFNIDLYDVDEEFNIGMAILRKQDYTLQQASFKGNKPIVVKSVAEAVNDDDELVYELTGWRNGAEYKIRTRIADTFATQIPNEIKSKTGLSLPPEESGKKVFRISDLAPGSVIQPMLNNEQLTGFTLFYDGKNPVYYEYSTYTLPAAITDSECMILSGRVYSVTTNGFMYTKNAGGEEITVMRNITAGSGTKIYLAEDGKVSECTRDEIRENDKVILYYDYASLNMIVIQR